MAVGNKFLDFSEQVVRGVHAFGTHTFKVMLSNSTPLATNTVKADVPEITVGNGYPSGGYTSTITVAETSGVTTVQGTQIIVTASGGTIGPFRYAILYNDSAANKPLVAWWDYETFQTLQDGETLTLKFNNASPGNVLTLV